MELFVNNLTNIDFSYLHSERGIVGESWLVQLTLKGELNAQGMICDFGDIKNQVKQWFDNHIDHQLLVPTKMPNLEHQNTRNNTHIKWLFSDGMPAYCNSPEQAIYLIPTTEINEIELAKWCENQLIAQFPKEVEALKLNFNPEQIEGAYYHYTHGLQQHKGNCQRIAHGHRSKIKIYLNGKSDPLLESKWAQIFNNKYIGSKDFLIEQNDNYHTYAYNAPQGKFEIQLPSHACCLIDTQSTVELIAVHLAKCIKQEHPQARVEIYAYEGIGKGAIASA